MRVLGSLYISYLGLSDPLVETQVVAYLEGLAQRGHRIHLLTFEPDPPGDDERRTLAAGLAARGITWHNLTYHKRPSLPATIYDTLRGTLESVRLVRKHRLDVIHARSHVPAAMALAARRLTGCGLIFDIRGLLAEEYVDAGRWKRGGIPWKLTKWAERRAIEVADACVVLTPAARELLFEQPSSARVSVIPCCVDVDRFAAGRTERDTMRSELGLNGKTVAAYVGKFGGWYLHREMVEFFAAAAEEIDGLHFLVLTQGDKRMIEDCFAEFSVDPTSYTITQVPADRVGAALAAADFGVSFVGAFPSKIASSPTKIGEYLAAGLPIASTAGVGDVDGLVLETRAGVLIEELSREGYRRSARELESLLADPETRDRCVEVARSQLSLEGLGIPRYDELYSGVAAARLG